MARFWQSFTEGFSPLKIRNFRIYIIGQVVSLVGTWLQVTAQGWVVWELSHSEAALGIVNMLATLPLLLLGPWAGVLADRADRRRVLAAGILCGPLALRWSARDAASVRPSKP